jgi:hypothetical protein
MLPCDSEALESAGEMLYWMCGGWLWRCSWLKSMDDGPKRQGGRDRMIYSDWQARSAQLNMMSSLYNASTTSVIGIDRYGTLSWSVWQTYIYARVPLMWALTVLAPAKWRTAGK